MTGAPTQALDRALTLLSRVVANDGADSLTRLAADLGVPTATAHRLVATLERRGFVARVGRGRYVAGPTLLDLAPSDGMRRLLVAAGRPVLDALAAETRLTAHLGVFEGDMVTYLVKAGREGRRLFTREGMQLEAYCSAIGKILLAHLPEPQRRAYLRGGPFVPLTPRTITDPAAIAAELDLTRARDLAIDDGEYDSELFCIAVPVRRAGKVIAALSLSALSPQPDVNEAADALRRAAQAIEARLRADNAG